jgi:anti-sigma B factor antagonist
MSNVAIAAPDPTMARDFSWFSCRRFDTVGTVRVAVAGELDMATVPELDLTLRHAQADARVVVLDLRELDFIDSSGAHLLLAAGRRAREAGGRLLVARGAAQIDRLFALLSIDRQLELVNQPPAEAAPAAIENAR